MAVNSRFRTLAFALRSHVTDTYALLATVDAVMALDTDLLADLPRPEVFSPDGHATYNWTTGRWDYSHEYLVTKALSTHEVIAEVAASRKINAIKALHTLTMCGLKAAKDAVEDDRIGIAAANLLSDPWYSPQDEPPF